MFAVLRPQSIVPDKFLPAVYRLSTRRRTGTRYLIPPRRNYYTVRKPIPCCGSGLSAPPCLELGQMPTTGQAAVLQLLELALPGPPCSLLPHKGHSSSEHGPGPPGPSCSHGQNRNGPQAEEFKRTKQDSNYRVKLTG